MAPKENIRRMKLSDPGVDLSLSLSLGGGSGGGGTGTGRKRTSELVMGEGIRVAKQRVEVKRGGGGGISGAGWFPSMYPYHTHLRKSVSIGTGKSTSVVADQDSRYFVGGSSTNSDSSSTTNATPTDQYQLNSHLSMRSMPSIAKANQFNRTQRPVNPNPNTNINTIVNRIFPKIPHVGVAVRGYGTGNPTVTGFLYRVTASAEVIIVCACHGTLFSPSGFVEHAGWTNVANPLRLIVVKRY